MGKFADLHKLWEEAKKKAPDKELAKKTFKKNLGPLLDELEEAAKSLFEARKTKFNPENILLRSAKVEDLCGKAAKVATEYEAFSKGQKWTTVENAASKIKTDVKAHGALEAKEWRPDAEYIKLWKYVTLEMALSAAGLEDARTAEDLRKLMNEKTKDINAARQNDRAPKENIEKLSTQWLHARSEDNMTRQPAKLAEAVAKAVELANPPTDKPQRPDAATQLNQLVASLQDTFKSFVAIRGEIDKDLKALKDYVKKPEVQNSAWKKLGDDNVKAGEAYLKSYSDMVAKCIPVMAKLPKLNRDQLTQARK